MKQVYVVVLIDFIYGHIIMEDCPNNSWDTRTRTHAQARHWHSEENGALTVEVVKVHNNLTYSNPCGSQTYPNRQTKPGP